MQPGWEVPSQARVIRAPRKNPSLGDILVRAKLEGRVRTPPEKLLCHLAHRYMVRHHVSVHLYGSRTDIMIAVPDFFFLQASLKKVHCNRNVAFWLASIFDFCNFELR